MPQIWFIADDASTAAGQTAERVEEHFGAAAMKRFTPLQSAEWRTGDVAVLFLESQSSAVAGSALLPAGSHGFVNERLAAGDTVIPILVGGVTMPGAHELPPELRDLSFKHALPLRVGPTLTRDVGRLIENIEAQLRWIVGDAYPHDHWLMTVGVLATMLGVVYSIVFYLDMTRWSFGHDDLQEFRRARRWLFLAGPFALGAGLLAIGLARWRRAVRVYAERRAERLRRGSGEAPERPSGWAAASICGGLAAGAWGLPAAVVSLTAALFAWAKQSIEPLTKRTKLAMAGSLAVALAGSLWTADLWRRERGLRRSIVARHEALNLLETDAPPEEMEAILKRAVAAAPWYGNAKLDLADHYASVGDEAAALNELDQAIAIYPVKSQGVLEPSHDIVSDAYEFRAELRERQGDADGAEADRKMMNEVKPFLTLFGGSLRFWEWRTPRGE